MDIRTATPADYDRIVGVMDAWWGRPVAHILPRLFLNHFWHTSFVAEDGDALQGFLVGFLSPADPRAAYAHAVAVAPEHRRTALAATLYRRFFDLARAQGRSVVNAVTSPFNDTSLAFHTALGFAVTEPIADYDGLGTDRVLFTRPL
jgi:predicted GNAT superfamily acetyltransferase